MPPPVLYSFRRCPYAMRARLAIRAAGIAVQLREVVLRNKPVELIALSPKATVPVLQRPDGSVLEQSLEIMLWALSQNDPHGWLRTAEQPETQGLIDLNDGRFKQLLDRYKYASRHPEKTAEGLRDEAVADCLAPLEDRLARNTFLLRDTPSIADMALLPFVRQFAAVDGAWFDNSAALPHLRAWLHGLVATPLFESVMQKYPPWQPGDPDVLF
jgi:glutathione S-transferase